MKWRGFLATAAALLTMVATARAEDKQIVSTFDVDLEQWQADGGELTHRARDGGGAYLEITDTVSRHSMAVMAPERFLGNLSRFNGGTLRFDVREIAIPTRGPWSAFGVVTIIGGEGEARADLSPHEATKTWSTYSIPLVASNWKLDASSSWAQILSDVKAIRVTLESCCVLGETVGFDNFQLVSRSDTVASEDMLNLSDCNWSVKNTRLVTSVLREVPACVGFTQGVDEEFTSEHGPLSVVTLALTAKKKGTLALIPELFLVRDGGLYGIYRACRGIRFLEPKPDAKVAAFHPPSDASQWPGHAGWIDCDAGDTVVIELLFEQIVRDDAEILAASPTASLRSLRPAH